MTEFVAKLQAYCCRCLAAVSDGYEQMAQPSCWAEPLQQELSYRQASFTYFLTPSTPYRTRVWVGAVSAGGARSRVPSRSRHEAGAPAGFPWASCFAVAAALFCNCIEFIAGQCFHARAQNAAAANAAAGRSCDHKHAPEVPPAAAPASAAADRTRASGTTLPSPAHCDRAAADVARARRTASAAGFW